MSKYSKKFTKNVKKMTFSLNFSELFLLKYCLFSVFLREYIFTVHLTVTETIQMMVKIYSFVEKQEKNIIICGC